MGLDRDVWEERREVLRRCAESGVSAAEFCRREGLPYWKFNSWKKRLVQDAEVASAASPVFAEVVVAREELAAPAGHPLVEIVLPTGAVVRVFAGADSETVRASVAAVSRC